MIDLHDLLEKRVEALLRDGSDLRTEYELIEEDNGADWGVLAILDGMDRVVRYEFIESEESWRRPEAIKDYDKAANNGIPVSVIVPNEVFLEMSRIVQQSCDRYISVFGYDAILLRKRALPA